MTTRTETITADQIAEGDLIVFPGRKRPTEVLADVHSRNAGYRLFATLSRQGRGQFLVRLTDTVERVVA